MISDHWRYGVLNFSRWFQPDNIPIAINYTKLELSKEITWDLSVVRSDLYAKSQDFANHHGLGTMVVLID